MVVMSMETSGKYWNKMNLTTFIFSNNSSLKLEATNKYDNLFSPWNTPTGKKEIEFDVNITTSRRFKCVFQKWA